ncbi:MAG: tRNA preQ1(34) S-adenosylmethionine ribosyltransferase-isomerase QueA [Prochlorothrix sp.]
MVFSIAPHPDDTHLSAYDYDLPPDRIAQNPVVPRDHSRLLVVTSPHSQVHSHFYDLPQWLQPGDLLVLNNTRVIPARLRGHKVTPPSSHSPLAPDLAQTLPRGAAIEVLLLEEVGLNRWLALVKPGRRLKPGTWVVFCTESGSRQDTQDPGQTSDPAPDTNSGKNSGKNSSNNPDLASDTTPGKTAGHNSSTAMTLVAQVLETDAATGGRILQFTPPSDRNLWDCFHRLGQVPLPPYITDSTADPEQYQTVYGSQPGAVAAPTAGLHFTPELLAQLKSQGIDHTTITLHVGVGTFRPVEVEEITQHDMHGEWVEVSAETVAKIDATQRRGGRIIAVGTTVTRALEGAAQATIPQHGKLQPHQGKVNLFIYPGYSWQVVAGLITNFHLPRSSLMMLVSALIGRPRLLDLYAQAVAESYRFYSFGDAMLILPEARPR